MWSAPGALSASIAAAGASNASSRIPDPWLHIEDTHINDSAKLVTLPGIVTLAVTWAHRCVRDPGDGTQANPPEDAQTSQEVLVPNRV